MSPLAELIANDLRREAHLFSSLVDNHRRASWPEFLRAWGELRRSPLLLRDEDGRYLMSPKEPASSPE
jgi:hypothetical protein